jgi:hypothetical protein
MFEEGIATIDTNVYIQGIITLTPELGNIPSFIAYLQDSTAGICLTVSGENSFAQDSEVKILCRGASFTLYNGLLQFGDISISDQTELIRLTAPLRAPAAVTIDELLSGKHQAEYVKIDNVQFKDPGTFSGSKTVTNCTSQIVVYTRSDATFASGQLPAGNGTLRGVASVYGDIQILLRDNGELDMNGERCGLAGMTYLSENFSNLAKYSDVSTLPDWKTYAEAGGKTWYGNEVGSRKWVQATAYNSGQSSVIAWMIAPVFDLSRAEKPYVSFESADGYDNGATMELCVSTNYNGSATPWTSTWTILPFILPPSTASGYSQFVSSGQIDLSPFKAEQVTIAWIYRGADPSGSSSDKTTTWEVDNVVVGER